MSKPEFVYATYIETTPEKLWQALTDGDFTERYWFGHRVASDWEIGSPYNFSKQDKTTMAGRMIRHSTRRSVCPTPGTTVKAGPRTTSAPRASPSTSSRAARWSKLTVTHDELDEGGKTLQRHLRRLADGAREPEEPPGDRPCLAGRSQSPAA